MILDHCYNHIKKTDVDLSPLKLKDEDRESRMAELKENLRRQIVDQEKDACKLNLYSGYKAASKTVKR